MHIATQTERSITTVLEVHNLSSRLTRLSDGHRELAPQLCLQILVVVRIHRGIKKAVMSAPEIYQHVVHCRSPVWPPNLTSKVCHSLWPKLPLSILSASHGLCSASSVVLLHPGWDENGQDAYCHQLIWSEDWTFF